MSDTLDYTGEDDEDAPAREPPETTERHHETLLRWARMPNVADEFDEAERSRIAQTVLREYDIDEESRAEYLDKLDKWTKLATQVAEQKTYPWPGASNVIFPIITTAALQFHARAYPAIIRDKDVVKGTVNGPDEGQPAPDPQTGQQAQDQQGQPVWIRQPGEKAKRAQRIGEHMSWQLLSEMKEWEGQTDRLLLVLSISGTMFRKTFFDPTLQRNVSYTVDPKDLCVNYKAQSFEIAPRKTEIRRLYPFEIQKDIRAEVFLDQDYLADQGSEGDEQAPITFLEQHTRMDLDGDGYDEPWIITVQKESGKLARIRAGYDEDTIIVQGDGEVRFIEPVDIYTKFGFIPNPESPVYDVGFGHLLYPLNDAINTSLNQMFDAGHLANAGGGFIGSQLSMNTGAVRFQVGEYKPVNVQGGTIRDNVFPLPFPGPNPVLFELLQFLVQAAKEVAAVKDVMVGDLPGDNTSGIATLAMIEQGLAVFSAIYKRVHRSLKAEFDILFRLNRIYLNEEQGYRRGDQWRSITRQDYAADMGVEPISDPRMVTDMQRLGRSQFLMQFKDDPWFDPRKIRETMLDATLFPDADKLLVKQPPQNPDLMTQTLQLQLEKDALALREKELDIRAAREEADLDLRRGTDKASGVLKLAQAINQLAQAAKADNEVNQGWYGKHLEALKLEMDRIQQDAEQNPAENSPSVASGGAAAAQPSAIQPMAQPPGQPAGLPVPPGSQPPA